jgi:hypothetical protein
LYLSTTASDKTVAVSVLLGGERGKREENAG